MNQVTLLREKLRPHLAWHGARLSFVAAFLIALFRVKTVNFSELATAFSGKARTESNYKRLQRFFRHYELDYAAIAHTVVALMGIPEPWVLSIDRTEWKFGSCTFNVLMLAVEHEGIAFPLCWHLLDKEGCCNTEERTQLFNQYLACFSGRQIDCLTGDREFIGQEWFKYLLSEPCTPFRIRIRDNHLLVNGSRSLSARIVFQDLRVGQMKVLRHRRKLWGHRLYIAALRLEDGSLLVVATQKAPKSAIADYAKRWSIETLFGILKSRGFRLEDTHLQDPERLSKLLALLTLALCWAVLTGEWLHQLNPIALKTHSRRAKSLFRSGFDYLRTIFFDLDRKMEQFLNVLQFLSCT